MLTVTRPDGATRTEVLGGGVLSFVAGVARVDGALRPPVEAAVRAAGYVVDLERPAAPPAPPEPAPTALPPAALPPVPPA